VEFLSPLHLGDTVLLRARVFFGRLAKEGRVGSLELVELLGLKGPTSIPANLTNPLKKRATRLGLEKPWDEAADREDRTVWVDRDGIAERMLRAIDEEVERLASFLPTFEDPSFIPGVERGGERDESGAIQMPWFDYAPEVLAFQEALYRDGWIVSFDWPRALVPPRRLAGQLVRVEAAVLELLGLAFGPVAVIFVSLVGVGLRSGGHSLSNPRSLSSKLMGHVPKRGLSILATDATIASCSRRPWIRTVERSFSSSGIGLTSSLMDTTSSSTPTAP